MLGKTLDAKYRIERHLGSGGMGAVYAADEIATGKRVAIKVLHGNRADSADMIARFEREARVAGSIETEHIARCYATGTDPETESPYIVLEYLVGEDLQRTLKRLGPLPPEVALRVVAQACAGIAKAHEAKIIHRDIKPANIFLAKGEGRALTIKVLDFGVAKARRDPGDLGESSSAGGLTRTGAILGSPLYMSPEQARSVKSIDHRADLWSLGVVLYQALAGRTPYEHISSLGDLIIALCSDLPPAVQELAPWVPLEVAAITDRALRIDPGERFQTADEMLATVRELLRQGIEVQEDMLVALDAATRGHVAPTYLRRGHTSSPGALRAPTSPASPGPITITPVAGQREPVDSFAGTQVSPSGRPLAPATTAPAAINVATTGPGVVASNAPPKASSTSKVPVIAVAVACCVAGGAGVYLFTRQAAPAPAAQPPPTVPTQAAPTPIAAHTSAAIAPTAPTASATAPPAAPSATATASAEATAPTPSPGEHPHAKPPHVHATGAAPTAAPLDLGPASFGGRK